MDFRFQDVIPELEAVTRKATIILSASDAAQSQLQIQNAELKDEVQKLRAELEASQRTTTTTREEPAASEEFLKEILNQAKQFKILGVKLDEEHSEQIVALLTSYVEEKEPSQKHVKNNQELRRAIENVKVENKGLNNRLKAEESSKEQVKVLKESVEELESKCSKLQKDLDWAEKELAVKTKIDPPKKRANRTIIEQGNDAAHRADGKADAALFHAGFLSNAEGIDTFQEVYCISFCDYMY
jgi:chromosome segregation ATPase